MMGKRNVNQIRGATGPDKHLALASLTSLDVWATRVSVEGVKRLRQVLPKCDISHPSKFETGTR